jgi:hypothetical protein
MWDARQLGQMRGRPMGRTIYSRAERSRTKKYCIKFPEGLAAGADEIVKGA